MAATLATHQMQLRTDAIWHLAACVTQPRLMRVRPLIRRPIALALATRNTGRDNGSNVRAVTTTPQVCRSDGKSVRRALSNIFRRAIIRARPVTTAGDHSAVIRISRRAVVVTRGRVSGRDDSLQRTQRKTRLSHENAQKAQNRTRKRNASTTSLLCFLCLFCGLIVFPLCPLWLTSLGD